MPVEHTSYQLYGVHIATDLELPTLQGLDTGPVQVTIRRARLGHSPAQCVDEGLIQYKLDGSNWLLHYRDTGSFCIRGTDTLLVDALFQASALQVRRRLLGSVFGLLLRRRGLLVLHANVLERNGAAILLLGDSGAGKSTLSAALCRHGYSLLSDDLGVIELSQDGACVLPGPAHLKLRPDSTAALCSQGDAPGGWDAFAGKYVHPVKRIVSARPVPLRSLYVLESGPTIALNVLPKREALLALIRNAHLPRSLDVTGCSALHFLQAAWIARQAPMYRLVRGATLSTLPDLVDTVETHLHHAARPCV